MNDFEYWTQEERESRKELSHWNQNLKLMRDNVSEEGVKSIVRIIGLCGDYISICRKKKNESQRN